MPINLMVCLGSNIHIFGIRGLWVGECWTFLYFFFFIIKWIKYVWCLTYMIYIFVLFFDFWSFSFSVEICLFIKKALWSSIIYRIIIILLIIVFEILTNVFLMEIYFMRLNSLELCVYWKNLYFCVLLYFHSLIVYAFWSYDVFYFSLNNLWQDSGLISVVKGFRF